MVDRSHLSSETSGAIKERAGQSAEGSSLIDETGGVVKEHVVRTPEGTTYVEETEAMQVVPSEAERRRARAHRIRRIVYFVAHTISIFTFIRFLLMLLGANPENAFSQFIMFITAPFVAPFINLFGPAQPLDGLSRFDGSLLFAIAIYYLFAWIIAKTATFAVTHPTATQHPMEEQQAK